MCRHMVEPSLTTVVRKSIRDRQRKKSNIFSTIFFSENVRKGRFNYFFKIFFRKWAEKRDACRSTDFGCVRKISFSNTKVGKSAIFFLQHFFKEFGLGSLGQFFPFLEKVGQVGPDDQFGSVRPFGPLWPVGPFSKNVFKKCDGKRFLNFFQTPFS